MVPCVSIVFETSKVSFACQLCSPRYTAVQIKKSTTVVGVADMKIKDGVVHPSYNLIVKNPLRLFVSYVQLVTLHHILRTD